MALPALDLSNVPAGLDASSDNITRLCDRAIERATAMGRRVELFEGQVIQFRQKAEADRQSMISNADGANRDIIAAAVEQEVKRATAEYRANLARGTEAERKQLRDDILAVQSQLEAIDAFMGSPQTVLMRSGLGSAERTNYIMQLKNAGPVELSSAAQLAIFTGNKALASALLSILDAMPKEKRPFSGAQLAERMVADEYRQIKDQIAQARDALSRAHGVERAFTTGRTDPLAKIARGLLNQKGK